MAIRTNTFINTASTFLIAALMTACGGESAKEAEVSKEKEASKAGKGSNSYKLNTEKSAVQWTGRKKTGMHAGTVDLEKGQMKAEKGKLQAGSFVVDMTTIHVTDDMDSSSFQKLMGHLRSPDFFSVDSFPKAKFELTDIKKFDMDTTMKVGLDSLKKAPTHHIAGNLTMKGITKNVGEIPAWVKVTDDKARALIEFSFDRTRWDVMFGSRSTESTMKQMKDGFIYDQVDLRIHLNADAQKKSAMDKKGKEKKEMKS